MPPLEGRCVVQRIIMAVTVLAAGRNRFGSRGEPSAIAAGGRSAALLPESESAQVYADADSDGERNAHTHTHANQRAHSDPKCTAYSPSSGKRPSHHRWESRHNRRPL